MTKAEQARVVGLDGDAGVEGEPAPVARPAHVLDRLRAGRAVAFE